MTIRAPGEDVLNSLGIARSTDSNGRDELFINFPANGQPGVAESRAVFDSTTRRWNLVTIGQRKFANSGLTSDRRTEDSDRDDLCLRRTTSSKPYDWTDKLPNTAHVENFKRVDWAATQLGPLHTWGLALRLYVEMLHADSGIVVMYWGPDKLAICNGMAFDVLSTQSGRPTDLMGTPIRQMFAAIWQTFEPVFESVSRNGLALDNIDVPFFTEREWGVEETYFAGSFLPLKGDQGAVEGFYTRAVDVTKERLEGRRTATLSAIALQADLTPRAVWNTIFQALAKNDRDFPVAVAYSARPEDCLLGQCMLQLEQLHGIPPDHPALPSKADIYSDNAGFLPSFRKARALNRPVLLHSSDNSLPIGLTDGFDWRGFGEPSTTMAVIPVSVGDRLFGFLVVGLNPRRPYDSEYEFFLHSLSRQISSTVAAVTEQEEARKREERLMQQLAESEKQIRDVAEYAPVGIARITPTGVISWANPQFYDIAGLSNTAEHNYDLSFMEAVFEEDKPKAVQAWLSLPEGKETIFTTVRIKRKWMPPASHDLIETPTKEHAWVLAVGHPLMENGILTSVVATITDISAFKWAESVQAHIAEAAKEAKRLQENFIDITSHEMRNPLSAITQCADGISESLNDFASGKRTVGDAIELLEANIESAKIILLCAAHQKTIIDDVLTLSKLDSMMLSITPTIVQPAQIVSSALKMYEVELVAFDVQVICEPSLQEYDIDWVYLDPSRLTQILANLVTNAIKFTKPKLNRQIIVHIGASLVRPPSVRNVNWVSSNRPSKTDLTQKEEWGKGEPVYIHFAVSDTGKGLEEHETVHLFNRFQQANPKTHVKYGGSGLGLFISRELTEMQGGEIGLCSTPGEGSTFAFYIKARRADSPRANAADAESQSPTKPLLDQKREISTSDRLLLTTAKQQSCEVAGRDAESVPPPSAKPPSSFSSLCILLVEDNLVNAKVLGSQLRKVGHHVLVANHGVEALDMIRTTRSWTTRTVDEAEDAIALEIDVILMDVEMPVMDGLTCTRRIRQLEQEGALSKHFTIIAITANAREQQIDTARLAGMDDVLPKPFKVAELLAKVFEHRARHSNS